MIMKAFHEDNRLHLIWGNHDMVYRNEKYVQKHLSTYFDPKTGKLVYHKATKEHWWSDTIRFGNKKKMTLKGERLYKVRWDIPAKIP